MVLLLHQFCLSISAVPGHQSGFFRFRGFGNLRGLYRQDTISGWAWRIAVRMAVARSQITPAQLVILSPLEYLAKSVPVFEGLSEVTMITSAS